MSSTLEKEWAAVDQNDEIVMKADSESELRDELEAAGEERDDLEIIALPKSHNSLFI